MTFQKGKSGNPAGRPKGVIDKRVQLRVLLEDHAEEIITKLIQMAKLGDPSALRLCVDRLLPKSRLENCFSFDLPQGKLDDYDNILRIAEDVTRAVVSGQLTIEEAQKFSGFLLAQRNRISTAEENKQEALRRQERQAAWEREHTS